MTEQEAFDLQRNSRDDHDLRVLGLIFLGGLSLAILIWLLAAWKLIEIICWLCS
jgi:hypothetical protein